MRDTTQGHPFARGESLGRRKRFQMLSDSILTLYDTIITYMSWWLHGHALGFMSLLAIKMSQQPSSMGSLLPQRPLDASILDSSNADESG